MAVFDPTGWMELSEALSRAPDEASQRAAIGRAYYACHISARDKIFGLDNAGMKRKDRELLAGHKTASEHMVVSFAIAQTASLGAGARKRLSDQLAELRSMRHQADYYMDSDATQHLFSQYAVAGWEGLAKSAVTLAKVLLPDLTRIGVYSRGTA